MSSPQRLALIVGVNDYSAFDTSLAQEPGTSDLDAAVRDALSYAGLAVRGGMPRSQIRLLLAPRKAPSTEGLPADLDIRPATRAELLAGLRWLAEGLAADAEAVGLFAFAGCGATDGEELFLCGSDTTGLRIPEVDEDGDEIEQIAPENAVSFTEIQAALGDASKVGALTVFLDACYAQGAPRRGAKARALVSRHIAGQLAERRLQLDAAVICAAAANDIALEYDFVETRCGVLSQSVEMVLGRFSTGEDALPFHISAATLVARAAALTAAHGVDQWPVALGSDARLADAVLAPRGTAVPTMVGIGRLLGSELMPGSTSTGFTGDYTGFKLQVTKKSGTSVELYATGGVLLIIGGADVVVGGKTFKKNIHYWYFPTTGGNSSQKVSPLTLSYSSDDPHYAFMLAADNSIQASGKDPSMADAKFINQDFDTQEDSIQYNLSSSDFASDDGGVFKIFDANNNRLGYLGVMATVSGNTTTYSAQNWLLPTDAPGVANGPSYTNTSVGQTLVFKPVQDPGTVEGWMVTDNKPV